MAERKVAVTLAERDICAVEQAVIDRDRGAALDFLERVVKPQIDAALKAGCRPVFEWRTAETSSVQPPPVGQVKNDDGHSHA